MFEASLIESTHATHPRSRWPAAISFFLQAALATLIVTLPLLHPERVLTRPLHMTLTAPAIPKPPTPPPPLPRIHLNPTDAAALHTTAAASLSSHPVIDRTSISSDPGPDAPPLGTALNLTGAATGNLPIAIGSPGGRPSVAVASGPPHTAAATMNISTGVAAGMLLAPIQPVYPAIARSARQQGTVEVHAIISRTGRVESAEAVSGPAMLRAAAVDAVRSARYRPFLLNGQPTQVNASFSIHFTLGN